MNVDDIPETVTEKENKKNAGVAKNLGDRFGTLEEGGLTDLINGRSKYDTGSRFHGTNRVTPDMAAMNTDGG